MRHKVRVVDKYSYKFGFNEKIKRRSQYKRYYIPRTYVKNPRLHSVI